MTGAASPERMARLRTAGAALKQDELFQSATYEFALHIRHADDVLTPDLKVSYLALLTLKARAQLAIGAPSLSEAAIVEIVDSMLVAALDMAHEFPAGGAMQ